MKLIKISVLLFIVGSLGSCLKAKNDFAGLRTDEGNILTGILETQYHNADGQNIGFHYSTFTNFSFTQPATEEVRFFSLHISQPRDKKLSGPLMVKIAMTAMPGYTMPPAGAITVPADVVVPASEAKAFDFPVKLMVNKAGLDVNEWYGVRFTITSVSQGVYSNFDKSIDVIINGFPAWNTSRFTGRYEAITSISDSANAFRVNNNTRPYILAEGDYTAGTYVPNFLFPTDITAFATGLSGPGSLFANNQTTGASTAILSPVYRLDATGKVIDVLNRGTLTSLNPVFDASAPNSFMYTANDNRVLSVKYTVRLTFNGLNRPFIITDKYVYDQLQLFY